jgi:hypothetical protein
MKKAQICQNTQIPQLSPFTETAQAQPRPERKQAICSIPAPKTHWQIREVLGHTGFCQIWIPIYSLLAKPLYKSTKGGEWEPLEWGEEEEKACRESGGHSQMPLLWLMKPLFLYVHELKGTDGARSLVAELLFALTQAL